MSFTVYVPDAQLCELELYELDLNVGLLRLTFNEAVNASSAEPENLVLLMTSTQLPLDPSSSITSKSLTSLDVHLTPSNLNSIKLDTAFGASASNTFLTMRQGFINDLAAVPNANVPATNVTAAGFTADQSGPTVVAVALNLTSEVLIVSYSEAIQASSVNVSKVIIASNLAEQALQLGPGRVLSIDGPEVHIALTAIDVITLLDNDGLAVSISTSLISIESDHVLDMASNPNVPVSNLRAAFFADTIKPVVLTSFLDMDTSGQLRLGFSEPIVLTSINLTAISITSVLGGGSRVVLTDCSVKLENQSTIAIIEFTEAVRDHLTVDQAIATQRDNSFISLSAGALTDKNLNAIDHFEEMVTKFASDRTRPELRSCLLDMTEENITLTFSEVVQLALLNLSGISVSGVQLATSSLVTTSNSTSGVVSLSFYDLSQLQANASIAVSAPTTICVIDDNAIADMTGNLNHQQRVAGAFVDDVNRPSLTAFSLNRTSGSLSAAFSEVMLLSSFNLSALTLSSSNLSYTLGSSSRLEADYPSSSVLIRLSTADLNNIKALHPLCIADSQCALKMDAGTTSDMVGNALLESQIPADAIVRDQIPPKMQHFSISMDQGKLRLTFDEPIDVSTANASGIYITANGALSIQLSNSSITDIAVPFSRVLVVALSRYDSNRVKNIDDIASSRNTSLIFFDSFLSDVDANAIISTSAALPLEATSFTPDQTPPEIIFIDFNLDTASITISFDEVVRSHSVIPEHIRIQGVLEGADLALDGNTTQLDSTTVQLSFTKMVTDIFKLSSVARQISTTRFVLLEGAARDVAGNLLASTTTSTRLVADDTTNPELLAFAVNMNTSTLSLHFNEPVDVSTLQVNGLTLQNQTLAPIGTTVTLTNATAASTDGLSIILELAEREILALQKLEMLFVSRSTALVTVTSNLIMDMAGNPVTAIADQDALQASSFTEDAIRPVLSAASMDLSKAELLMTFSEVMNVTSLKPNLITLSSDAGQLNQIQLTGSGVLSTTDSTVITITVGQADLDRLSIQRIAMNVSTAFIGLRDDAIKDQNGLAALSASETVALQLTDVASDEIIPSLSSFQLDMNAGTVTLSFSETVTSDSVHVSSMIIQQSIAPSTFNTSVQLGGAFVGSMDGPVHLIWLTDQILNDIKRLATLGTDVSNTFIQVSNATATDVFGNELQPSILQASVHVPDATAPELRSFDFSLNAAYYNESIGATIGSALITLTFSETININSINTDQIALTGDDNHVSLTGLESTVSRRNGTSISFKMLNQDVNILKAALESFSNDTLMISLSEAAIEDMAGNPIQPTQMAVARYEADRTPPVLLAFQIDVDRAVLSMIFDETVDGQSLEPVEITLVDGVVVDKANLTLSGALNNQGQAWTQTPDRSGYNHDPSTIIAMTLMKADLDELKRLDLCSKEEDCYFVHTEWLIRDQSGIQIVGCV
eukprot:TRINITY_DN9069_c0_g1_i2.p1 TRINITY_DN9069_c0_g1~~TRINITY_DN9069_c0_g1_i2.p1  ORF type:complete len:1518 (+),score=234.62 TRINITY_DN9069_c0_g1_i2:202-4554(+)